MIINHWVQWGTLFSDTPRWENPSCKDPDPFGDFPATAIDFHSTIDIPMKNPSCGWVTVSRIIQIYIGGYITIVSSMKKIPLSKKTVYLQQNLIVVG